MILTKQELERDVGLGSFSIGTLRNEDIGNALLSLLDKIGEVILFGPAGTELERSGWNGVKDTLLAEWEQFADPDSDQAHECVEEMWTLLEEALPEGFYAGSTEGDGADFGIWPTPEDDDPGHHADDKHSRKLTGEE